MAKKIKKEVAFEEPKMSPLEFEGLLWKAIAGIICFSGGRLSICHTGLGGTEQYARTGGKDPTYFLAKDGKRFLDFHVSQYVILAKFYAQGPDPFAAHKLDIPPADLKKVNQALVIAMVAFCLDVISPLQEEFPESFIEAGGILSHAIADTVPEKEAPGIRKKWQDIVKAEYQKKKSKKKANKDVVMAKKEFFGTLLPTDECLLSQKSKKAIHETRKVRKAVRQNTRNAERSAKVLFSIIAPALWPVSDVLSEGIERVRWNFYDWVTKGDKEDFFVDPVGTLFLFHNPPGHYAGLEAFLNEREIFDKRWGEWKKEFRETTIALLKEKLTPLGVKVTVREIKKPYREKIEPHYYSYEAVKQHFGDDGYINIEHPVLRIRLRFLD